MAAKMKERVLDYSQYLEHARHNELEILASTKCGCLSCGHSSSARLVKSWFTDEQGLSASCPNCGLSYVVGDASGLDIGPSALKSLCAHHAEKTTKDSLFDDYAEYCAAYFDGKIEATPHNEGLYLRYLHVLADEYQFPLAIHALAVLYGRGGTFVEPDFKKAIFYYRQPPLCYDSSALFELGGVYQHRNQKGDMRRAFESYVKSSAMGSISASLRIGGFYLSGVYVQPDPVFGLNCLLSGFGELFLKAFTAPMSLVELSATAFDIATCFRDGSGAEKSPFRALRYFLLSDYLGSLAEQNGAGELSFRQEAQKEIEAIAYAEKLDAASKEVVFDEDTFFDTFLEQYDSVCRKSIVSLQQESDRIHVRITSDSPLLIMDIGNLALTHTNDCTWSFPGVSAEFPTGESFPLSFERIEVDAQYVTSFIHEDPVYGDVVVMRLYFPEQEKE